MIGKRLWPLCVVIVSLCAREYRVPVRGARNTHQDCSARIELQTTHSYQREPVSFTCYFQGPRHAVSNVKLWWNQDESNLYMYPHPHVSDANDMRTWRWSGVWYPQDPGVHTIPRLYVSYIQERRRKGRSGMLGSIWGGFAREEKEMQVPVSEQVFVKELPETAKHADAIGSFGSCQWINIPEQLEVGATYEIGIQVTGAGSFPEVMPPEMPQQEGLRCFYIGERMERPVYAYQKTFMYAIYATSPGTYICNPEGWSVYDPEHNNMQTLHPGALKIHAYGARQDDGEAQETPPPEPDTQEKPDDGLSSEIDKPSQFRMIYIPWRGFMAIVALPITLAGVQIVVYGVQQYRSRSKRARDVKRAFYHARSVAQTASPENGYQLYRAYMHLFHALSAYTGIRENIVFGHISRYLPAHYKEWNAFWEQLLVQAFAPEAAQEQLSAVHAEARKWLHQLYAQWKRDRHLEQDET